MTTKEFLVVPISKVIHRPQPQRLTRFTSGTTDASRKAHFFVQLGMPTVFADYYGQTLRAVRFRYFCNSNPRQSRTLVPPMVRKALKREPG